MCVVFFASFSQTNVVYRHNDYLLWDTHHGLGQTHVPHPHTHHTHKYWKPYPTDMWLPARQNLGKGGQGLTCVQVLLLQYTAWWACDQHLMEVPLLLPGTHSNSTTDTRPNRGDLQWILHMYMYVHAVAMHLRAVAMHMRKVFCYNCISTATLPTQHLCPSSFGMQ